MYIGNPAHLNLFTFMFTWDQQELMIAAPISIFCTVIASFPHIFPDDDFWHFRHSLQWHVFNSSSLVSQLYALKVSETVISVCDCARMVRLDRLNLNIVNVRIPKSSFFLYLVAPLVDTNPRQNSSAMLMLLLVVFLGLAVFLIYKFKRYPSLWLCPPAAHDLIQHSTSFSTELSINPQSTTHS